MPYGETKVYFDGSHYIAIPHTTRPAKPRRIRKEEEIEVAVSPETADNDVENSPIDEQTVADETRPQQAKICRLQPMKSPCERVKRQERNCLTNCIKNV